ncbi:MAG: glycosyltransferase family 2 protein, partial [Thermoplasmata archaeon]|nr:glycosyltransferase family 2 protein [Thermoplasmata archaeon]
FKMIYVVIPAHNEEGRIGNVVRKCRKVLTKSKQQFKIIVFNDGSTDGTRDEALNAGAELLETPISMGKGNAIMRTLFFLMNSYSPKLDDIIVLMDGDGQHNPADLPEVLNALKDADMVVGARDLSVYPLYKRFGNFMISLLVSVLLFKRYHDVECGFRAFKWYVALELLRCINPQKYEIEAESIVAAHLLGFKIVEVPISSPVYHQSKGVGVITGLKNFYEAMKTWLKIKTGWLRR